MSTSFMQVYLTHFGVVLFLCKFILPILESFREPSKLKYKYRLHASLPYPFWSRIAFMQVYFTHFEVVMLSCMFILPILELFREPSMLKYNYCFHVSLSYPFWSCFKYRPSCDVVTIVKATKLGEMTGH